MWFITLVKFRRPPTQQDTDTMDKHIKDWSARGVKIHNAFFTMGRFDQVWVWEAPDDTMAFQNLWTAMSDAASTETFPAWDRDTVNKMRASMM